MLTNPNFCIGTITLIAMCAVVYLFLIRPLVNDKKEEKDLRKKRARQIPIIDKAYKYPDYHNLEFVVKKVDFLNGLVYGHLIVHLPKTDEVWDWDDSDPNFISVYVKHASRGYETLKYDLYDKKVKDLEAWYAYISEGVEYLIDE